MAQSEDTTGETSTGETSRRQWRRRDVGRRGSRDVSPDDALPAGMRIAGAWSWRLLAVGAALAVVIWVIIQLRELVIPVLVAVLVSALLVPLVEFLQRHRCPRWLAIFLSLLLAFVIVAGLLYLAIVQIKSQAGDLKDQSVASYEHFRGWLTTGPLGLSQHQIDGYLSQAGKALAKDSQIFISGALSVGSTVGHLAAGFLIALFSTLFILIDGRGIWVWIVRLFPRRARSALDGAGQAGWTTLRSFVRVQILVAAVDAAGIGIAAAILQLPLVIPIAVLVFLGSFIPVVGAVLTGVLAVFVALVYNGWVAALIMLGAVLVVQEIEGHVLQPLIMGTAVKVHPLAVVLAVAGGSMLAGIPGALFAVPFAAVLNVMVRYIADGQWRQSAPFEAEEVPPLSGDALPPSGPVFRPRNRS